MDIIGIIDKYGIEKGDKAALVYRDTTLTYKELKEKSDALASYIIHTLGRDKTPIIVYGHKQIEMIICFLACTKSGHSYIPIDTSFPKERVREIAESSKAKILFNVEGIEFNSGDLILKDNDQIKAIINGYLGKKPDISFKVGLDDTYYILYTSGSTGKPKGVQITLSCMKSFLNWYMNISRLDNMENLIFMNQVSYSFDVSVMDLYVSLISCATLFTIDKHMISNFKELFYYFSISNMDVWVSTPSMMEMCLIDESFNYKLLPNLKMMVFAGEVLTNSSVLKLFDRFKNIKIINGYGPTEATVLVTAVEIDKYMTENINPLPIGYPIDSCRVYIADSKGNEVLEGEKGEIIILGDSVSPGYYGNDDMTEKSFFTSYIGNDKKRGYKTGDEGYIKDGLVFYLGRMDFQVKLNGFRIELGDIEHNLRKIDFIKNAVVLPVYKNGKVQYLAAFVTLDKKINEKNFVIGQNIKNELKKYIPDYMIPRKIVIKESFDVNVNGKIDRKVLMGELI